MLAGNMNLFPLEGNASNIENASEVAGQEMEETYTDTGQTYHDVADAEETNSLNDNYAIDENISHAEETNEKYKGQDLGANSWRFQNGIPDNLNIVTDSSRSYAPSNAWTKVNGQYISSDGSVIEGASLKGIDVSSWNGKIDWSKVKADGIDFAIIRCATGWKSNSYDDSCWEYNASECERLGISYGVYFYSYATSVEAAKSEADHTLRLLQGHHPTLPVYYDLEDDTVLSTGNTVIGQMAQAYCDKISAAGYRVGIYANLNWWNNYLTSSVFTNPSWSKWVAQYYKKCSYGGAYDIWQCTSEGRVNGIEGNVDLNFWMNGSIGESPVDVTEREIINYQAHMQTYGWMSSVANGYQMGVTGFSKRLEAFKINVGQEYGNLGVEYTARVQGIGWQDYVSAGETAGTTGAGKWIEAVKIRLTGTAASNYDIYYRVHSQNYGWLGWASNGNPAGTQGYDKRIEAMQIAVLPKGSPAPGSTERSFVKEPTYVIYQTYVNGSGWQSNVRNGQTSGTVGASRLLEGMKITIGSSDYQGNIVYNAYMQGKGWTGEKSNMAEAGMPGSGKRMEAIQIKLTGALAEHYDIYYRAHCQSFGWLGWARNGETAGSIDYARRMEAMEIRLVKKGEAAPGNTSNTCKQAKIKYMTHVQTYGWQNWNYDGASAGTTGQAKRLEAIRIAFPDSTMNQYLKYKTHVQTYGWQNWVSGGTISGTTGKAKRLEAIQIMLEGKMAEQYDIYYRVHSQTYGWLDWAKNGESAGTAGLAKRLESIQIVLVEKGGSAPGSTERPFISK